MDLGRRSRGAARDGSRDRRSRHQPAAGHVSAGGKGERSARPTLPHRARTAHRSRRPAALCVAGRDRQHAALPRDRRRPLGGEAHRRAHRHDLRLPQPARSPRARLPSAATGSWRRRRRSKASTPRSRAARSTTRNPDGWVPNQKISASKRRCARTRRRRPLRLVRGSTQGHAGRRAVSRTWSCSTATSSRSRRRRYATRKSS